MPALPYTVTLRRAVIDRLEQTATSLGNPTLLGHGLVNMAAAVNGLVPSPQPGAPATATLTARAPKRMRISTARRHGIPVVCASPQTVICTVRVTSRRRVLARGSRQVTAGIPATINARLTDAGRRSLKRAARIAVHLRVTASGSSAVRLTTTLTR